VSAGLLGVQVRPMRAEDVDAVVAIEAEAFSSPWSADTFEALLERDPVVLRVLEDAGGRVIGYSILWCILDQGELANIAVAAEHRGRGLGAVLLRAVVEECRRRGVTSLYLEVRASNERALALYRAFGFTVIGKRKNYYDRPREDARLMVLDLED